MRILLVIILLGAGPAWAGNHESGSRGVAGHFTITNFDELSERYFHGDTPDLTNLAALAARNNYHSGKDLTGNCIRKTDPNQVERGRIRFGQVDGRPYLVTALGQTYGIKVSQDLYYYSVLPSGMHEAETVVSPYTIAHEWTRPYTGGETSSYQLSPLVTREGIPGAVTFQMRLSTPSEHFSSDLRYEMRVARYGGKNYLILREIIAEVHHNVPYEVDPATGQVRWQGTGRDAIGQGLRDGFSEAAGHSETTSDRLLELTQNRGAIYRVCAFELPASH